MFQATVDSVGLRKYCLPLAEYNSEGGIQPRNVSLRSFVRT